MDEKEMEVKSFGLSKLTPEAQIKGIELVWGNPVIFGIMVIGIILLAVVVTYAVTGKDPTQILIPGLAGIGGLAGGVAIGKLTK